MEQPILHIRKLSPHGYYLTTGYGNLERKAFFREGQKQLFKEKPTFFKTVKLAEKAAEADGFSISSDIEK